jgi:Glycosyl transferases group 1
MSVQQVLRAARHRAARAVRVVAEPLVVRGVLVPTMLYRNSGADRKGRESGKPHFLIARYNHYASNPALGPSIEEFILDDTLRASQLGTADTYFWETGGGFPKGDRALLDRCRKVGPDAIILSSYEAGSRRHPSVEALRVLRAKWGIPIIAFWWDTCWRGFWPSLQSLLPFVDVHVVTDNPLMSFLDPATLGVYAERFLPLWVPVDPVTYTDPLGNRDLDVAFLGQVGGYRSPRVQYIRALMEHNVPIFCSIGNDSAQPSHEKYLEVLKRTKIGLNFSHSVDADVMKWRVFETISCGALLMENDNPQTHCCFTPMRDYVSFDTPADLVDKVRYYLAHEDERDRITTSGKKRLAELYDHLHFWTAIIEKLNAVRSAPLG